MKYRISVNDRELEVTLLERNGSALSFEVEGQKYSTSISPILSENLSNTAVKKDRGLASSANAIVAPMPGIIVSLSVNEGQTYSAGDTALIIEAMKMENNISFPIDAKVSKIHITEGDEVEGAQLLISITPI